MQERMTGPLLEHFTIKTELQEPGSEYNYLPWSQPELPIEHVTIKKEFGEPGITGFEFLPESHQLQIPEMSQMPIHITSTKTYCRLCMNLAPKNQLVCLGNYHDLNYPSRTEQFKRNKILQTKMYIKMINSLMPEFDHGIVFNSVMCNECSTRLQMASDFVEQCMTTQQFIKKYKQVYCPTVELVSMEEVIKNKSTLDINPPKIKRTKTVKISRTSNTKAAKPTETVVSEPAESTGLKPEDIKIEIEETAIAFNDDEMDVNEEHLHRSLTHKPKTERVDSTVPFESAGIHTDSAKSEEINRRSIPCSINRHSLVELTPVQFVQPMPLHLVQPVPFNYIQLVNPPPGNIVCANINDSFAVDPTNINITPSTTGNIMCSNINLTTPIDSANINSNPSIGDNIVRTDVNIQTGSTLIGQTCVNAETNTTSSPENSNCANAETNTSSPVNLTCVNAETNTSSPVDLTCDNAATNTSD